MQYRRSFRRYCSQQWRCSRRGGPYIATRHQLLASTLTRRGFSFSENAMTLKKLLGHNERTGFSETSIIICAVLTGAGICALGISLCLLMQWAVLNGYVLF
jgi:hypothetical protein